MLLPYELPSNFNSIKMMSLHDCLAANSTDEYLKNKILGRKDLEKLPLLILTKGTTTRIMFYDYCTKSDIEIHPEMEFGSNTLIKEFTGAGFGIGLLTEEHIKRELESGELFKLDLELPLKEKYLGMIWNKVNKSLIAKNFIKYISERR